MNGREHIPEEDVTETLKVRHDAGCLDCHEGVETNGKQDAADTKYSIIDLEYFAEDVHQLNFDVTRGCAILVFKSGKNAVGP